MAKPIVVRFKGAESRFDFAKLERKKLYGSRRRMPLGANGEPCKRAALTDDGRFLVRSGMSAQGYFTDDGRWIPNRELQGITAEGSVVEKLASTLGEAQDLTACTPQTLLDHKLTTIYMLDAQDVDAGLQVALEGGEVFQFDFNYRADFRAETGFILQNKEGLFVLVGTPALPEWVETSAPPPIVEAEEEEEDELDFEMF